MATLLTTSVISFHSPFFLQPLIPVFRLPKSTHVGANEPEISGLLLSRITSHHVVNCSGEASKPRIYRGVIFKLQSFPAAAFINVRPFLRSDWCDTNVWWITREAGRKMISALISALVDKWGPVNLFFSFRKKKTVSSFKLDKLNGLIQKIDSKKPRGTLKPNYSLPKIVAKRVISAGLICINYSFIIPADHSNYTVLFDLF